MNRARALLVRKCEHLFVSHPSKQSALVNTSHTFFLTVTPKRGYVRCSPSLFSFTPLRHPQQRLQNFVCSRNFHRPSPLLTDQAISTEMYTFFFFSLLFLFFFFSCSLISNLRFSSVYFSVSFFHTVSNITFAS